MDRKVVNSAITLVIFGAGILVSEGCSPYFTDPETESTPSPTTSGPTTPTDPPTTRSPPRWTLSQDPDALHFVMIGDIGGSMNWPYTTREQLVTADALTTLTDSFHIDFIAELGDNFYHHGVTDVSDSRFQTTFEDVYNSESLRDIPWYIVAGNHDWEGNIHAQVEYSRISERWNYPALYYSKRFPIPNSEDAAVRLIMIDTMILCGNVDSSQIGSPPVGADEQLDAVIHLSWLEHELATASETYVIVGGHYPVWSMASHGPTYCLVDELKPLLERYNVTAYFGGHDHCLQHIHEVNSTVEYFVSGAGHLMDPSEQFKDAVPEDWQLFHFAETRSKGGFAYLSASAQNLTVTFTGARDMYDLYEITLSPGHRSSQSRQQQRPPSSQSIF